MPFSNEDEALIKNFYQFKSIQFSEDIGGFFEDKVQK